jgi:GntR family transcriptional regulator/MocR family aminotransferase
MAAFISEGYFGAHVRNMRQIYRRRHKALLAAVQAFASKLFQPVDTETGLTITLLTEPDLASRITDRRLAALAGEAGLHASALSSYCYNREPLHGLMVGLGLENERELTRGVENLARSIAEDLQL